MEHHADFAIPVAQDLNVTTTAQPDDGYGPIEGRVIALGWWVQPETVEDPDHVPAGTLYLVVDERRPRPMWVREAQLTAVRLAD
ncbi:MAG: hypothetical protein QNJ89_06075 [Acidimicrobiia bacterium]|nr:hypothetical protein [Acidimicrobiia bacterium]